MVALSQRSPVELQHHATRSSAPSKTWSHGLHSHQSGVRSAPASNHRGTCGGSASTAVPAPPWKALRVSRDHRRHRLRPSVAIVEGLLSSGRSISTVPSWTLVGHGASFLGVDGGSGVWPTTVLGGLPSIVRLVWRKTCKLFLESENSLSAASGDAHGRPARPATTPGSRAMDIRTPVRHRSVIAISRDADVSVQVEADLHGCGRLSDVAVEVVRAR